MKAGALQTNIFLFSSSLCHVTHVFKIVSCWVMIHVYSGIWKKKVFTYRKKIFFPISDVVVQCLREGVIN